MIKSPISRGLSANLLLMTIGFVMLAELVIFIPSATLFRQSYLQERAERAGHLTLALTGVPDYEGSEILSQKFVDDTGVIMVASKQEGMTELVLGMPPDSSNFEVVDLRDARRLPLFRNAFATFFGEDEGYLRIIAEPVMPNHQSVEIILPKANVKMAMRDFFERIFWLSLAIALITGVLIYMALAVLIVRPIQRLATGLGEFREDPNKRRNVMRPSNRRDEIGQLEREFFDMKQSVRTSFRQRERLASLGMAVAKINHDLRNVLTSAQLVSDRIAMDKDERVAGMGERLVRAVDRGIRLCTDVLNSELTVYADADHTYRIVHNIFRNAGQAMQALKGPDHTRSMTVKTRLVDDKIELSLRDTAGGIPEKIKENLFRPFASSSGHGSTGLGLTISKELARDQGGDLVLAETGPEGTEFLLTLPAMEPL